MKALVLSLLLICTSVFAKNAGKVIFVKGKVYQITNKKKQILKKDDKLFDNSMIITSDNSIGVISLNDGSKLKINKNSKLQVKLGKIPKVALYKGSSFFNVLKDKVVSKTKFKVITKTASLGVRGTEFFVSYGKDKSKKDVWMCVNEGLVSVKPKNSNTEKLVKEGEGVHISDTKNVTDPAKLPWTKKLNWKLSPQEGSLENTVSIEDAYTDLLDQDYD
jgi:hypothetical protein